MRPTALAHFLAAFAAAASLAAAAAAKTVGFDVSEGTMFAAAPSPDGKTLAMDLQGRIWTLPAAGGRARPITPLMREARFPVWSPDGRRIAFQYYAQGNWRVAVAGRDGSALRQLTTGRVDDREPAWRPDGRTLVFSSDRTRSLDLWELSVDGGPARPLTTGPADDYYPSVSADGRRIAYIRAEGRKVSLMVLDDAGSRELLASAEQLGRPLWSADGARISVNVYNAERGDTRIDVVDASTGKVVATRRGDEDIFPTGAAWLGERILYAADGGLRTWAPASGEAGRIPFRAHFDVMPRPEFPKKVFDFNSTGPRPLLGVMRPMVSPDGGRIAFTALGDLWLLKIGDPEPTQLTRDPFLDVDPAWSPDGKRLAYVSDRRGTGAMDLIVRNMADGAERRLTTTEDDLMQPSWSPDGRSIAVFMRDADDWHAATLYVVDVETGAMRKAHDALFLPSPPSWTADGKRISVLALRTWSARFRKGGNAFFTIDLATGTGVFSSPHPDGSVSTRSQFGPIWSPDGKQIAYVHEGRLWSGEADADGRFLKPPVRLTDDYASYPSWTGDSRSLVYLDNNRFRRVRVADRAVEDIPFRMNWTRPAQRGRTVIQAGRVFTAVSPDYLKDVDIVIDDNRIVEIAPRRAAWPGADVIDARGKTVVPGLFQTHIHQFVSDGEKVGRIWLSFGVTSVREPGAEPYEALERREAWMSGQRLGPRQFFSNILEGPRLYYWMNSAIDSESHLNRELKRAIDLDYDFIKTYETMDHEVQKRIVDFAHGHGLMVASHELYPAATYGVDAIEHLGTRDRMEFSDRASIRRRSYDDVVQLLAHSGMYISPTAAGRAPGPSYLTQIDRHPGILSSPQFRAFAPKYQSAHADMMTFLRRTYGGRDEQQTRGEQASLAAMSKADVLIGTGTDGGTVQTGFSVVMEAIHFAEAFGPYKALQSATIDSARITGVDKDLGSVEVGKLADLVIVDGDPLADLADLLKVDTVVKDGRAIPLSELLKTPN